LALIVALLLALGAVILIWVGRQPYRLTRGRRLLSALFAALAAVGAVVSALRGGWIASLVLIGLSAWLGRAARLPPPPPPFEPSQGAMSAREARAILGVTEGADSAAIQAAYRRLMQRAHPDHGGTAGLAAQLNAARDRLLRRTAEG
jgi:hypothetical protein